MHRYWMGLLHANKSHAECFVIALILSPRAIFLKQNGSLFVRRNMLNKSDRRKRSLKWLSRCLLVSKVLLMTEVDFMTIGENRFSIGIFYEMQRRGSLQVQKLVLLVMLFALETIYLDTNTSFKCFRIPIAIHILSICYCKY